MGPELCSDLEVPGIDSRFWWERSTILDLRAKGLIRLSWEERELDDWKRVETNEMIRLRDQGGLDVQECIMRTRKYVRKRQWNEFGRTRWQEQERRKAYLACKQSWAEHADRQTASQQAAWNRGCEIENVAW